MNFRILNMYSRSVGAIYASILGEIYPQKQFFLSFIKFGTLKNMPLHSIIQCTCTCRNY